MTFKLNDGSSSIIIIILMLVIISVAAIGFVLLIAQSDNQVGLVNSDPTNLSGITYTSEVYNGTNSTLHGLSNVMPNFIWVVVIFLIIAILLVLAVAFGKRG